MKKAIDIKYVIAITITVVGVLILRLWSISSNQFVFYDEGMYLVENRQLLKLIEQHPAVNVEQWLAIAGVLFKSALATAKAFWFFLLNLRVFVVGTEGWYISRLISAFSGLLTLGMIFLIAKRLFNKRPVIAWISVVILSVLPSHVFYSRLGMQESFSTLLFIAGIYCYLSSKKVMSYKTFLCALLFLLTFLCNYRMIIAPIFALVIEAYYFITDRKSFSPLKLFIVIGVFVTLVTIISQLYGGINYQVTFGWMAHQAEDAKGKFDLLKLVAFPLNTFILEGWLIGLFFWYGVKQLFNREFARLLPFALVLTQMAIFSVAADQGARYLCVVLPFFALSCAQAVDQIWEQYALKYRVALLVCFALVVITMVVQSTSIMINKTSYEDAVRFIKSHDPQAKIIATQPLLLQLYVDNPQEVVACPKDIARLGELMRQGYRYLVIDPQAYISWVPYDRKFNLTLYQFLEDIRTVGAIKIFDHFNNALLTRFVLDHNEHVSDSLQFIAAKKTGQIEIYDLAQVVAKLSVK